MVLIFQGSAVKYPFAQVATQPRVMESRLEDENPSGHEDLGEAT